MALIGASWRGHESIVVSLLQQGVDVNAVNDRGETALIHASENGYESLVRVLLKHGADVNTVDKGGWTALLFASSYGHKGVVRVLLEHGANVNAVDKDGRSALMRASLRGGHENIVRVLLEYGADVNAVNSFGSTALIRASFNGRESIARLLRARMILKAVQEIRYKQFKVIRLWLSFENLHSPSSNQMFYGMGTQLRAKQAFEELKQEVPYLTRENYHFYMLGVET